MSTATFLPRQPFLNPDGTVSREWLRFLFNPTFNSVALGGALAVGSGGTGLSTGTPGGVLAFSAAQTLVSSQALGSNQLVLGGGIGFAPSTPVGLGVSNQVLHGNAAGAPSWSTVQLSTDVSGVLAVGNGGTGANLAGPVAANNIGALAIANNLADVSSIATARTNLGLGTLALQSAAAVAITGGNIDGTVIGATTKAAGSFTALTASSTAVFTGNQAVGTTLAAWGAGLSAIDVGATSGLASDSSASYLASNLYFNGTNWIYKTTAAGAVVQLTAGALNFYTSPSGTAGTTSTLTLRLSCDVNGNLAVANFAATGTMKFGTFTAGAPAATGFISITDAGGTTRKILVG